VADEETERSDAATLPDEGESDHNRKNGRHVETNEENNGS
jgi:hypothetical protein